MTVAFTPHDRPPRLIRKVETLAGPDGRGCDLLAVYDFAQNILIICRPMFDRLSLAEQREVERTHEPALVLA